MNSHLATSPIFLKSIGLRSGFFTWHGTQGLSWLQSQIWSSISDRAKKAHGCTVMLVFLNTLSELSQPFQETRMGHPHVEDVVEVDRHTCYGLIGISQKVNPRVPVEIFCAVRS
jgi:hypothetical protein